MLSMLPSHLAMAGYSVETETRAVLRMKRQTFRPKCQQIYVDISELWSMRMR